jgi:hypothetical protein
MWKRCQPIACVLLLLIAGASPARSQSQGSAPSQGQGQGSNPNTVEPPFNPLWSTDITAASNPNNFDTPEIMAALYTPHPDLVLLSAHRGLHALANTSQTPRVPENSLESIGYAAEAGWEMIELDIKLTSDGVPILSHDKTWGREWCAVSASSPNLPNDPFLGYHLKTGHRLSVQNRPTGLA